MSLPTAITTIKTDFLESVNDLVTSATTTTTISPPTTVKEDSLTASPTIMDMWMTQLQKNHPEISFVVPSQHDNQHIDNMMQFKQLLERVGNTAYDTLPLGSQHHETNSFRDSLGQTITHEQIKNSAVLNMAELKNNALTGLERYFADTDMHSVINYLWVAIVFSLVVLTVVFVLFSCHFYRKFREWKKCNKDIRAHFSNDMYRGVSSMPFNASSINPEAAYYQVESPPCYTIATGLPTYDEALHHNQQNFAFGMKFIYPTLAAVHYQASNLISSWEKYDTSSKDQKAVNASATAKCKSSQTHNSKSLSLSLEASTATLPSSALLMPPSYEVAAASMALLSEQVTISDNNIAIAMPELLTHSSAKMSRDLADIKSV